MILDTVLRMEASIEELRSMVVCNNFPTATHCDLMPIIKTRLSALDQM
jgi:hypothetical protein